MTQSHHPGSKQAAQKNTNNRGKNIFEDLGMLYSIGGGGGGGRDSTCFICLIFQNSGKKLTISALAES